MGAFVAGPIGGAVMNPAMTLALAMAGKLQWALVPGFVAAQLAGAFVGAVLVYLTYLAHWRDTDDPALKLGIFCTAPAIRRLPANLIAEAVATFVLVFVSMAMAVAAPAPGFGPLGAGLLVTAIGMSLGGPTGYAINPARDLAPRIAHALLPIPGKGGSDWGYAWVPVLGPLIGAALAVPAFEALY
ncbi:MIP/aquaporin family protein [Lysobacter enzymogenes]|uniref:MIP/aquaporin family protein n=1 Tax=Lysobacter enzymogenes TaxID=69 RepID=UPI002263B772|nr:MIP/aquaporin family protein [Lysobacter enzymogenes]UZW62190.1 aquaporin family protein [Lysobacter enzymogenes]